jgi:hypothetical protein
LVAYPEKHGMMSDKRVRSRRQLSIAVVLVVCVGLASRSFPLFPAPWGKYPGDALWATAVLFAVAFVRPAIIPLQLAAIALIVSYAVEFSQIYQGAWAKAVRSTCLGHLMFGSGFDWVDLGAYAIGVFAGFVLDVGFFLRVRHPRNG